MVNIRVLGENSYEIGKAFENLCIIVLGELGYCDFIPNVRKPGMEIDFTCKSKLLDQKLIAECKAKEELVSSSDYNVFYGKFTRERSRNDKYLNGVLLTISDFNSEVKESYESENEDIKHFLKLMNNKDIIKLLEESSLIKSLIIREIVDKYSGGEVIDESILFVQNKLYWSSKIELSEGKKAIIILNGNGEYLKDYEVDGIKNELQKLEIYKNIAIINPMIEDKIIMALLEIAMTKKEISNAVKESSLSVDNAVRKMIMDNIVEENTGKIELSRKTDSFVDVCNRILDSSYFNKFLQSSYCAKCLDEAIIRKISSRFYIDFETSEFEALLRILRVSKSALLFSLFGDTSKFLVSHEHVKEHCINGEQKKQIEEHRKVDYKERIYMALLDDINNSKTTDNIWHSDGNLNFVFMKLKISLGSQKDVYLSINSFYNTAKMRARGAIRAGTPVSYSGPLYELKLPYAIFLNRIHEFEKAEEEFRLLSKQSVDNEILAKVYVNWGFLYNNWGLLNNYISKFKKALTKTKKALELLEEIENNQLKSIAYLNVAASFYYLYLNTKKQEYLPEAKNNCDESIRLDPENKGSQKLKEDIRNS